MIDVFAASQDIPMDLVHCKAVYGKCSVDRFPVFLVKPQTYMNLSGESMWRMRINNRVDVLQHSNGLDCELYSGKSGCAHVN
ncbi:hypothetical protein LIER_18956 [Lithospermum erythrorhizon]|uniref:Uncharacterized protein n=1 Tax=Lithospermum erythrorhizon TaxID=34254 RepID=A0AAV3QIW1_LITER